MRDVSTIGNRYTFVYIHLFYFTKETLQITEQLVLLSEKHGSNVIMRNTGKILFDFFFFQRFKHAGNQVG